MEYINMEMLIVIGIVVALFVFFKYGKGKVGSENYSNAKLAITISKAVVKDKRMKKMLDIATEVVSVVEQLDMSDEDKRSFAIERATVRLSNTFNMKVDKDLVKALVEIAFGYMPKK